MNATETNTKTEPHKLDNTILLERSLWRERIKKWNRPMSFDDRKGWLRANLVREDNDGAQFIFGMEVADRYGEPPPETGAGSKKCIFTLTAGYKTIGELKRKLGQEAFAVICKHYFGKKDFPYLLPYQEPLFSTLLWFFRPYGGFGGWDNLRPHEDNCLGKDGGKHYLETACSFAKEFTRNAWSLANRRWYMGTEGDPPSSKMALPHLWDIAMLLRRLDMLRCIEEGQYAPRPDVFMKLLTRMLAENNVQYEPTKLTDQEWQNATLASSVGKDPLARSLYVARLNLDNGNDKMFSVK